jgi:hypothetical protein
MMNEPLRTSDIAGAVDERRHDANDATAAQREAPIGTNGAAEERTPLLGEDGRHSFLERWTDIQSRFVDSPREAVEEADSLVAEVIQSLATSFADERGGLERQWEQGDDIETEELRIALQRYRSFFHRLLAT